MKTIALLIAAALLPFSLHAADGDLASIQTVGIPSSYSTDGIPASTDWWFSLPLMDEVEYEGEVSSISGSGDSIKVITVTGSPGWTSNEWENYWLQVTDGSKKGQILRVSANTSNTLTVCQYRLSGTLDFAVGNTFELSDSATFGSLFGSSLPVGTKILGWWGSALAGTAPNMTCEYKSNGWELAPLNVDATDLSLVPGCAYILRTGTTAIDDPIIITGRTSVMPHYIEFYRYATTSFRDNPVGFADSFVKTLTQMDFPAIDGDEILVYDNGATGINKSPAKEYYFSDSTDDWYDSDDDEIVDPDRVLFSAGGALIYRAAPGSGDKVWTVDKPYGE